MNEHNQGESMNGSDVEQFQGFSDNPYQHDMHTLAWISLWLIIILGVGAGVFGFFWGLGQ
jgi:hypothetical protein